MGASHRPLGPCLACSRCRRFRRLPQSPAALFTAFAKRGGAKCFVLGLHNWVPCGTSRPGTALHALRPCQCVPSDLQPTLAVGRMPAAASTLFYMCQWRGQPLKRAHAARALCAGRGELWRPPAEQAAARHQVPGSGAATKKEGPSGRSTLGHTRAQKKGQTSYRLNAERAGPRAAGAARARRGGGQRPRARRPAGAPQEAPPRQLTPHRGCPRSQPLAGVLAGVDEVGLLGAGRGAQVVLPAAGQRHRHEDRLDAAASLEPEGGAAVVHWVGLVFFWERRVRGRRAGRERGGSAPWAAVS